MPSWHNGDHSSHNSLITNIGAAAKPEPSSESDVQRALLPITVHEASFLLNSRSITAVVPLSTWLWKTRRLCPTFIRINQLQACGFVTFWNDANSAVPAS